MDTLTVQIVSVVAIIGFLWGLHREIGSLRQDMVDLRKDVAAKISGLRQEFGGEMSAVRQDVGDLRERMSRVEGLLEGFIGRPPELQA